MGTTLLGIAAVISSVGALLTGIATLYVVVRSPRRARHSAADILEQKLRDRIEPGGDL